MIWATKTLKSAIGYFKYPLVLRYAGSPPTIIDSMIELVRSTVITLAMTIGVSFASPVIPSVYAEAVKLAAPTTKIFNILEKSTIENVESKFSIQNKDIVLWPCSTKVQLLINKANAPEGSVTDMIHAVKRLEKLTNRKFIIKNTQTSLDLRALNSVRKNQVLIGWIDPENSDLLRDNTSGVSLNAQTSSRIIKGLIALNIQHNERFNPGEGEGLYRQNLYLHELLHMLGLEHTEDRSSLMYPSVVESTPNGPSEKDASYIEQITCAKI